MLCRNYGPLKKIICFVIMSFGTVFAFRHFSNWVRDRLNRAADRIHKFPQVWAPWQVYISVKMNCYSRRYSRQDGDRLFTNRSIDMIRCYQNILRHIQLIASLRILDLVECKTRYIFYYTYYSLFTGASLLRQTVHTYGKASFLSRKFSNPIRNFRLYFELAF